MHILRPRAFRSWGLGASLLALSACVTAAAFLNTEVLVARGFSEGLTLQRQPVATVSSTAAVPVSEAQSEDFWLGHARIEGAQPVSWSKPLTIGDRVTISSGGEDRVLEVVDVQPLPTGGTHIASGAIDPRLLAVTCRDVKYPDSPQIRIIVADGTGLPAGPVKRQSAL